MIFQVLISKILTFKYSIPPAQNLLNFFECSNCLRQWCVLRGFKCRNEFGFVIRIRPIPTAITNSVDNRLNPTKECLRMSNLSTPTGIKCLLNNRHSNNFYNFFSDNKIEVILSQKTWRSSTNFISPFYIIYGTCEGRIMRVFFS